MPQFRYTARTKTGEELTGQLTAGDATWARRSLESAELEIISLERTDAPPAPPAPTGPASAGRAASPTESPTESPAPSPPPSTSPAKPQAAAPRLTTTQTQQLLGHLTATTASGLPIEDTLEALAAETDDRRLAETVRQLADRLRDGVPLDQAVVMLEKQLPPRIRGLLEVGVRCGDPAAVFEAFARQQLAARSVSRKIASTMAFPTIIFLITVPLLLFYALFLIPVFRDMFTEFDLELPALTVVAIKFGEAVTTILVVTMTILGVFWLISRLSAMSSLMCQFRAVVPLMGRMWTWAGHQELATSLATLVALRIPLPESLAYVANLLEDRNLAHACRKASTRLEAGVALSECMDRSIHFDRMLTSLVRWGEDHDLMPAALLHAHQYYDDRIDHQAALVRRILPPLMMVVVAIAVVFVVISLFLPLVGLIQGLSM